jgi:hypothetical protein
VSSQAHLQLRLSGWLGLLLLLLALSWPVAAQTLSGPGGGGSSAAPVASVTCQNGIANVGATTGAVVCQAGPTPTTICTTTCTISTLPAFVIATNNATITIPAPVAGAQVCAMVDDNVSATITFAALGGSLTYENQARTAYGTAGTGTLSSAAAKAIQICLVARDATHYFSLSAIGTWTAS